MARRLPERVFNPSEPLVAVKSFKANGRHYSPGDDFNWKSQSLDQRRVRQMFDARYVASKAELAKPEVEEKTVETKPKQAAKPTSKPAKSKKEEGE